MVKSLRYDQESRDNSHALIAAGGLRIARHSNSYSNSNCNPAPDGHAIPHGHADARVDLPRVESFGKVVAARPV